MKTMKKIKHVVTAIVLLIMVGCDDSYLDMSNHYGQNVDTSIKRRLT